MMYNREPEGLMVLNVLLSILVFSASCGGTGAEDAAAPDVALVRQSLVALGGSGPELRRSALAVSKWGHLAFTSGYHEGPELITIVDSTGRVIARTGRRGGGPGELNEVYYLFFQDSILFAADVFQGRLMQYDLSGEHIGPVPFGNLLIPIGHVPDSVDVTDPSRSTGLRVLRRSLDASSGHRELISRTDTTLQRLVATAERAPFAYWTAFGSTRDGALLADGIHYELFAFREDSVRRFGRYLPIQRSGEARGDTLSYFGNYSFGLDAHGRVWAVGGADDAGFIDAYEDSELIHHEVLDCRPNKWYGMSVAEGWLAVLCHAEEAALVEVDVRLYRVEG